jgi:hypothetical protein
MSSCFVRPIRRFAALALALCAAPAWAQLVGAPAREGPILPPSQTPAVDAVPTGPQDPVFGPGGVPPELQWLHPNLPPLDQVPPVPMANVETAPHNPNPNSSVMVHDGVANQTWELPLVQGAPASGGAPGYNGADGFVVPPEMARNFGSMVNACCLTSFPASANCRLLLRFVDDLNNSYYYVCSGAMQDSGMIMCASHCVYWNTTAAGLLGGRNPGNGGWAAEIWVYPGWDGSGGSPPGTNDIVQNWGWTHGTSYLAGANYVNNGDFDSDFGLVMCNHSGERHVGMLTGWFGYWYGTDCPTVQSRTYYNYSFPAENSGCCASGHNGYTMEYWSGTFDACPGNQLQLFTTCGCTTAVWGGMSGSNAYWYDGTNRYAEAVCSTSNRSTRGQYCHMWDQWATGMNTSRDNTRGATFDLEAFRFRLNGSSTIQATTSAGTSSVFTCNISNADPASAGYTVRVYLSTDDIITSSDTLLGTFGYTWDYGPLTTVTVNLGAVTIPNVAPGTYWLGAILDPGTDAFPNNNATHTWDAQQITVTTAPPPPPGNDNCASAYGYAIGNLITGTTIYATPDGTSSCAGNGSPDVWYVMTAPACGNVHFDTCGSNYDTVLSLHTACGAAAVACNDDSWNGGNNACGSGTGHLQSGFDYTVAGGTTYYIRVSGFGGASGNFYLNTYYYAPANDACSSATTIAVPGTASGCMGGASNDGEANCGASGTSADVWYTFTAAQTGWVRVTTCGSSFDTVLSVHSGCPGTAANEVGCNDDNCNGGNCACGPDLQSGFDFGAIQGQQYYIRIAGFASGVGTGAYTLHTSYIAPPNDACANAIAYGPGTTVTGVTTAATVDGSAQCGNSNSTPDVWYTMTPSCSGPMHFDLCGSGYDTVLSLHSGCPGTTANQLICNDDSISGGNGACGSSYPSDLSSGFDYNVVGGNTYLIRVSGYSGNSGPFVLRTYYLTAGSDNCATASPVGDGSYTVCNCGATTDGPQEHGCVFCCGDYQINNDLWFMYTAPRCGTATATTCGSAAPNYFDTKIAVYNSACPLSDDTAIACNDDAGCTPLTTLSRVTFPITINQTYLIRVGGFSTAVGTATLTISSSAQGRCGTADFNCDGAVGTDADIESFFACISGTCPPPPCCNNADFNGDGAIGTDADIEAFFRVLGGGTC